MTFGSPHEDYDNDDSEGGHEMNESCDDSTSQHSSQQEEELNAFYSNIYTVLKEDVSHPIDNKVKDVHEKFKVFVAKKFEDYKRKMVREKRKQDRQILLIKNAIEEDSNNPEIIRNADQKEFLDYLLYGTQADIAMGQIPDSEKARIVEHFRKYQKELVAYQNIFQGKFDLILTEYEEEINKLQCEYSLSVSTQSQLKKRKISLAKTRVVEMLAGSDAPIQEKNRLINNVRQELE